MPERTIEERRRLRRVLRFAVQHLVAGGVVVTTTVALTSLLYFAFLAGAAVAGEPLGGPLALPFLMLLAVVASLLAVAVVLLPTTVAAQWICTKYRLPWGLQIPLATAFLGVHLLMLNLLVSLWTGAPPTSVTLRSGVLFGLLLIPLGAYWWTTQAASFLLGLRREAVGLGAGTCSTGATPSLEAADVTGTHSSES